MRIYTSDLFGARERASAAQRNLPATMMCDAVLESTAKESLSLGELRRYIIAFRFPISLWFLITKTGGSMLWA